METTISEQKFLKALATEVREFICPQCGDLSVSAQVPGSDVTAPRHSCGEQMVEFIRSEVSAHLNELRAHREGEVLPTEPTLEPAGTVSTGADELQPAQQQAAGGVTPPGGSDTIGPGSEAPLQPAEQAVNQQQAETPPATPAAVAVAEEHGVDLNEVEGTGADGKVTKPDVVAHVEGQNDGTATTTGA